MRHLPRVASFGLAALAMASAANAAAVTFSTTAAFGSPGPSTPAVPPAFAGSESSTSGIIFTNELSQNVGTTPAYGVDFGIFTTPVNQAPGSVVGDSFTITINQTVPTVGSGTLAGVVGGTVTPLTGTGLALVVFSDPDALIGNTSYVVQSNNTSVSSILTALAAAGATPAQVTQAQTAIGTAAPSSVFVNSGAVPNSVLIEGTVQTVPLPGAAIAGGVLMAGLGLVRAKRMVGLA